MMRTIEFESSLNPDHSVAVPREIAAELANVSKFRVIVVMPDDAEENAWKQFGLEQFAAGYVDGDAIYDSL